ncbi:MAG: hypothetical protein WDZ46_03795 [Solirubrobacterales bacterium]
MPLQASAVVPGELTGDPVDLFTDEHPKTGKKKRTIRLRAGLFGIDQAAERSTAA